jgi:PAS domain S-box-containing protein
MAGKARSSSTGRGVARLRRRAASPAAQGGRRLRESAEQFRLAQETLGIVTWIWDVGVDRVQWHGDASPLLGMAPNSFSGRFAEYLEHLHPDDLARAKQTFVSCLKGEVPQYRGVDRVVWPDGGVHWLETYGRASYGADGRTVRMTGVIKDITERKQEESARVRAEKQLARVFDASTEYSVMVRASDGLFLAANPAFQRVTGYRADEIVGRTVNDINLWGIPGERERFLADLRREGEIRDRPTLIRVRDGRTLSGLLSASLFEHDGEQLVVSVMRDLTETKRLERRARQSERKYAALFETSPIALLVTRPRDRRIVEVNDAALRLLGVEREEAIGATTGELARPLDAAGVEAFRARALAGERLSGFAFAFERKDGKRVDCILSARLVEIESEPHLVLSALDVTESRQLEERASESERKFAALFENSPEPISLMRLSDEVRLAANSAWERVTGHSRDRASSRPATAMSMFRDRGPCVQRRAAPGARRRQRVRRAHLGRVHRGGRRALHPVELARHHRAASRRARAATGRRALPLAVRDGARRHGHSFAGVDFRRPEPLGEPLHGLLARGAGRQGSEHHIQPRGAGVQSDPAGAALDAGRAHAGAQGRHHQHG